MPQTTCEILGYVRGTSLILLLTLGLLGLCMVIVAALVAWAPGFGAQFGIAAADLSCAGIVLVIALAGCGGVCIGSSVLMKANAC